MLSRRSHKDVDAQMKKEAKYRTPLFCHGSPRAANWLWRTWQRLGRLL